MKRPLFGGVRPGMLSPAGLHKYIVHPGRFVKMLPHGKEYLGAFPHKGYTYRWIV
jgi:hypothetical protein